jgi:hypothetical protein
VNLIILVARNEEYAILKEFAVFEDTPNCREYSLCDRTFCCRPLTFFAQLR